MKVKTKSLAKRAFGFVLSAIMVFPVCGPVIAQAAEETVPQKSDYDNIQAESAVVLSSTGDIDTGYIRNDYIEAYINSNGYYTIGTVEGDPNSNTDNNAKLLFGHPNSSTTETLIRIDGVDYFFDNYVTEISFNEARTECVATAVISDIIVQQILTLTTNPYTNMEDVVSIRYTYVNTSSAAKQVGIRIMLDTMLGNNDGAPFRVNGADVTKEIEYSGNSVPQYWQSFDSLEEPNVTATGFFYFSEGEKPDKVQFAYWPYIRGSAWDFEVDNAKSLTGDSAVAAYFNPRTVAAGGSYSIVTYYGISGFSGSNSDLDGDLAARITAPSALYGSDLIGGYLNNPFNVSVYLTSPGSETLCDVRAVLSLADAPQLVLDDSQASTIYIGDMSTGDNATVQWTLRAMPQGTSSTAQYKISFYAGDNLLKVMVLSLSLMELNDADMYRTVTFDLNGGDGTAPAAQQVLIGSFAEEPEKPTREGYVFAGWYANQNCTGSKWFSVFNLYRGNIVTENVTLYAKWSKAQDLTYGEDTFDFENASADFFGWWDSLWSSGDYMLTGDYYDTLLDGRTYSERTMLRNEMNSPWSGSCFGMSAVLSLVRAGELDVEFFQEDADCLHDFDTPNDNSTVFNLINYYHLTQLTSRTASARAMYDTINETSNNHAVITALDNSAYPVVVGFNILDSRGNRIGGHAVVAYGYTETDNSYEVSIWDPNDKDDSKTLTISKDYSTSSFDSSYDTSSRSSYIKYALTVEAGDYDYKNIQQELMNLGYSSGADAVSLMAPSDATRELYLQTNYDSFTISSSDGINAVIENGRKVSGELEISDADYLNEVGPELKLQFAISDSGNAQFTITPETAISVVTGEALAEYNTVLICNDAVDGFYSELTADNTGTITFGADGTVSTTFESDTHHVVTVVANDAVTPWYAVTIEATTSGLSATPDAENTTITSQTDAQITVSAKDDYSTLVFETADVQANTNVELAEDSENPGTGVLGDQQREMGHSLIFYSLGGTPIEAQTNIPSGATATEPIAPTRNGFVFAGWYTTPACADGEEWNFNTPITEDVRIYAKWLTDDDYTHTVVFKADGQDDIMIIVRNGDTLNDNQIPPVPQKDGYIGGWDITDFSNITADIIVNAIYTANPTAHICTITFDPNGGSVTPITATTGTDGKLVSLPTPTRSGSYSFGGWYTAASGGTQVTTSTIFTTDTTIYAHWIDTSGSSSGGSSGGGTTATYAITIDSAENGDVTSSHKSASKGTMVSLTVNPNAGYELDTLTVTDDSENKVMLNEKNGEYTFTMPDSEVTVKATFAEIETESPFTDVSADAYYYNAVLWAVEEGITTGTSDTTFSPDITCTRAQAVTFLWRAAGSPVPKSSVLPFEDVAADAYYADAVLWAMERGITQGTGENTFSPDAVCTRAQIVTFLWRSQGAPAVDILNPFTDVAADAYYADAVLWAVENGVTVGTSATTFSPNNECSRAEVVTFLYRCFQ